MSVRADVVCGVDIGTTNVKVLAMDVEGGVVNRVAMATPRIAVGGAVDADHLLNSIENMLVEVAGARYAVRAVCAAGVGEDGLLVDEDLRPLGPALPWFDPERTGLLAELAPMLADEPELPVRDDAARTIVGWVWARAQPGAQWARHWLALTDFVASRWTSAPFMSDTLAARTAAWLPQDQTWLGARVRATLGDADLLPPVLPAGWMLGPLESPTLRGAGVLGQDAVVVVGGHDHPIGGWGVNRMHPGSVLDSMGTAEVVVAQSPHPGIKRTDVVDVGPGILGPGSSLLAVQELARNMAWASEDRAVGAELEALLEGTKRPDQFVDSRAFLPGAAGGGLPRYADDLPADPLSRASAVLGSLARTGTACVAAVAEHVPGSAPVYAAGGWARSPGWLALKGSISGSELRVLREPEVTAVGAALLAAEAIGWSTSPARALGAHDKWPGA